MDMANGMCTSRAYGLGNGESKIRGVFRINEKQYVVLSFTQSKVFKTYAGGCRLLSKLVGQQVIAKGDK
jgi:hypothetical protein